MIDLKALAAPFPPDKISWRAQTVSNGKALALAYIDARDVQDRLDAVCGPENWQNRYPHTQGKTVCEIGVRIGEEWVWKSDGAGDSDIEAEKGALSDAFKRAAVKWGIGRYLYDIDSPWVPCEIGQNGKFRKFTDNPWNHVRNAPKVAPPAPAPKAVAPAQSAPANGWQADAARIKTAIKQATTTKLLDDIQRVNATTLKVIEQKSPQTYDHLVECDLARRDALQAAPLGAG